MKKIALILVVIICCSVLVGCGLQNIGAIISDKLFHIEGTVLTAAETTDGDTVYITHGDNFSQDDIEFVLSLHGQVKNDRAVIEPWPSYGLVEILTLGKEGKHIFLAHFDNPYIICAYLKNGALPYLPNRGGDYKFDITKYVWYKFYKDEAMTEKIDGLTRTEYAYLLYDCTIEKDIVNNGEYNQNCKCYMEYNGKYAFDKVSPNMLLYFDTYHLSAIMEKSKFIVFPEYGGGAISLFVDENNAQLLYFCYEIVDDIESTNNAELVFREHYDKLSPYFIFLDSETDEYGRIFKYAGIEIGNIIDYLTKKEE